MKVFCRIYLMLTFFISFNTFASSSGATQTIVDMSGVEVTLPKDVKTIGTFGSVGVLNAFVELMGGGSKIVNELPANFRNGNWKLQYEFAPQIKGAPLFEEGGEIVIETVLKNRPDLCLVMRKDQADLLRKNGLDVVLVSWQNIDDIKDAVVLMGEILDKRDVSKKYLEYFDATVKKATDLTKDIKDKKTVLYGDPSQFLQPHLIAEWWIDKAGGVSVTNNGRTNNRLTYTMEDLLMWNPDIMMITNKSNAAKMRNDKKYSNLNAVKNNQVYFVPTVAHVWGNRTVEQPLTILWALNKLYPELFNIEELKEEIRRFYSEFFHYNLSEEQVYEIIG